MSAPRYFKYFAFISYSRKDEAFAKRLQNFLMSFKLPTRLCKQYPEKPQSLRPIYRDKNDLGVDNLNEGLKHGLNLSKFLIVICSENSARPNEEGKNWIDEEVRTFLSLEEGNGKYVIPVLLRQKEQHVAACLPPAVKELGLLAADVSDKGEKRVFSDVAAKMLGLEPDELWNWWERARLRKRRILQTLGGIAAIPTIYAGWLAWDYYAPHYTYFADYVQRNNIPQGIRPLRKEETKHLHSHYRFTTQYHRLTRVDTLNSAGYPGYTSKLPSAEDKPVSIELDYSSKTGKVSTQTYYNKFGKVVQTRKVEAKSINFRMVAKEGEETVDLGAGNASLILSPYEDTQNIDNKNVERLEIERDPQGYIKQERFFLDAYNSPIRNERGVWGYSYRRDTLGRPLEITHIDEHGEPLADRIGIVSTRFTYHPVAGQAESVSYHDAKGNLICCEEGYAIEKCTYNQQGNLAAIAYFDTEGKPCIHKYGYARMQLGYDARGNQTAQVYFDTEGKLCTHKEGNAGWKATYDKQGNPATLAYFDTEGKPCTHKNGYANLQATYDKKGNQTSIAYFDTKGKPCTHKEGFAKWQAVYDKNGNLISESYFDTKGKPCMHKERFARWQAEYNLQGNRISQKYFDTEGNPCMHQDGFSSMQAKYNSRGNQTSQAYFDTEGKPCMHKDGYASLQAAYDDQGNRTSIAYFDSEGKPCTHLNGYASLQATYDAQGNQTSIAYFGPEGKPCTHKDGYASLRAAYDAQGNRTSQTYFDTEGKPCMLRDGYASWKAGYDTQRNRTSQMYFDTEGKPSTHQDGYAGWKAGYDAQGNRTSGIYFDTEGKPCMQKEGYASWKATHDPQGNLISEAYFDTEGHPCLREKGYACLKATYDAQGNRTSEAYFDTEGKPCMQKEGYASVQTTYDAQGNAISKTYFDTEGQPIEMTHP